MVHAPNKDGFWRPYVTDVIYIEWVEKGHRPPDGKTVETDLIEDVDDPSSLSW